MQLNEQQVLALAPDAASAANGRKLASAANWSNLGKSARSLWGECKGSGAKPYQVRVDLADFASKCSCPSHKFPCKHALGLLVLTANQPALPGETGEGGEPDWVAEWLDKRSDNAARKEARAVAKAEAPVDEAAQKKRAEKRDNRVRDGLAAFQVWLEDLVRNGMARLPAEGPRIWEQQAARLVDAQAPGLAARVRLLADVPGGTDDWPERLLGELGRMALALRSHDRLEDLPPPLQQTLRQYLGYALREEDVLIQGQSLRDRWQVIGQANEEDDKVRVQRSWLLGEQSGRSALLLQFAAGAQSFAASWLPGSAFDAELVYYPGALLQRALLKGQAAPLPMPQAFSHAVDIAGLLDESAAMLAQNPWLERHAAVLRGVVARRGGKRNDQDWQVVDQAGLSLPLSGGEQWLWLALTGGKPCDVAVEWDGHRIRPLGAYAGGRYFTLGGA
ncbi:MAG TPA: SWIM zinc finger family protein [Burkholderiaceae bacterium]